MSAPRIPREVAPGVVWDEAAQERYTELLNAMLAKKLALADAEREACWAVEADLHRKFIKAQVQAGMACKTPEAKRALFASWVASFGEERAACIAGVLRHDALRAKVLNEW